VRYWIVAGFVFALTGCMTTASVLNEVHSDFQPVARYSALERYPLPRRAPGPLRLPVDSPAESAAPLEYSSSSGYSEEFWNAVADLDLRGSRETARSDPETRFAEAIALLAAGEHEKAESAFDELSNQATDLIVATGSQMMLATTLLYEHKWSAVRDLTSGSRFQVGDRENVAGLQRWGSAFAGIDAQVMSMPEGRVTVPLGVTPIGTPTIRVRINGKEHRFWLDTGSSMTVLSSEIARDAGVPIVAPETLSVGTFAGVAPARPGLLKRLEIGPITISNTPVIVIESRLMRLRTSAEAVPWSGLEVEGIIGWDTIRQFDIALDYEHRRVTLQKPLSLGTRGTSSQNLLWLGKPLVQVRTKSGVTLHFTLDTGAQGSFVNGAVLRKAQVTATNSNARPYGIARTGGQPTQAIRALALDVGGGFFVLQNLIVFNPPFSGLINCDGILGSDIAQFGTIRIDATNGLFSIGA
jgi:hypothetical protein